MSDAWPDAPPEGSAGDARSEAWPAVGRARTVDHDGRVGQRVTLPALAGREKEGAHGTRLPDAVRVDRRGDVLTPHGLVCRTCEFAKGGDRTCIYICMN